MPWAVGGNRWRLALNLFCCWGWGWGWGVRVFSLSLCLLKLPSLPMLAALPWPTDGAARCSAASDPAVCPTSITQWGKIREYGFMCPCPPTEDFFGMCIWSGSLCFPFLIIIVVFKHGVHTLLALGSFRGKTKVRLLNIQKNWSISKATVIPATARGYWGILSLNNGHQFSLALPSPSCLLDLLSGWLMRLVTDGQGPRRPRVHTRARPHPELACRGSVWPTAEAPGLPAVWFPSTK